MLIFKNKLVDIEASEVESRLKEFRLNLSDDDSLTGEFHGHTSTDLVYPCAEETLKKRFKRQRLSTSEKLYIYKQVTNLKTLIRSIAFDYHLSKQLLKRL